jgi:DNA-binding NtrC family response regulator
VLQEHEIRAVGAIKPRKVDVPVITATAKELEQEVINHLKNNLASDLGLSRSGATFLTTKLRKEGEI